MSLRQDQVLRSLNEAIFKSSFSVANVIFIRFAYKLVELRNIYEDNTVSVQSRNYDFKVAYWTYGHSIATWTRCEP